MTDVTVRIRLRNNATREERDVVEAWPQNYIDEGTMEFAWTEGNYGCDCNRELFFARAGGEPEPEGEACGSERFTALYAELPDGKRITLDRDDSWSE